jgi:hypothetical protein
MDRRHRIRNHCGFGAAPTSWESTGGRHTVVTAAAFSADGARIVMASDKTARVWNLSLDMSSVESWERLVRCSSFALRGTSLIANPDPLRVCTAAASGAASR